MNKIAMINMIKQQLRTGDVLADNILDLYESIPREDFVPTNFSDFAYSDLQIPLPHNQRMLTPLEEGKILVGLKLQGNETVLEIGTGTGFFTAILSRLCKKVISVEYYEEFSREAYLKLKKHNCLDNVQLITGDGSQGWLPSAPYDVIIFTSSIKSVSKTQKIQILPGGKLFAIVGNAPIMQGLLHKLNKDGSFEDTGHLIFETEVPPIIDKTKRQEFVF